MRTGHDGRGTLLVTSDDGKGRLVGLLGKRIEVDTHAQRGTKLRSGGDHAGLQRVRLDRVQRHAAPMYTPFVHDHGFEL